MPQQQGLYEQFNSYRFLNSSINISKTFPWIDLQNSKGD